MIFLICSSIPLHFFLCCNYKKTCTLQYKTFYSPLHPNTTIVFWLPLEPQGCTELVPHECLHKYHSIHKSCCKICPPSGQWRLWSHRCWARWQQSWNSLNLTLTSVGQYACLEREELICFNDEIKRFAGSGSDSQAGFHLLSLAMLVCLLHWLFLVTYFFKKLHYLSRVSIALTLPHH